MILWLLLLLTLLCKAEYKAISDREPPKILLQQQAVQTCSKTYDSYVLITQTGITYSTVGDLCNSVGAVPASINSINWSSMLNLYTWCGIGALPSSLAFPWIGGGEIAG